MKVALAHTKKALLASRRGRKIGDQLQCAKAFRLPFTLLTRRLQQQQHQQQLSAWLRCGTAHRCCCCCCVQRCGSYNNAGAQCGCGFVPVLLQRLCVRAQTRKRVRLITRENLFLCRLFLAYPLSARNCCTTQDELRLRYRLYRYLDNKLRRGHKLRRGRPQK